MNARITDIIIISTIVGLTIYDIVVFVSEPKGDTLSERLRYAGYRYSAIPYSWGVITGHFFLPPTSIAFPAWSPFTLLIPALFLAIKDIKQSRQSTASLMLLSLVVGIISGWLLWNQGS